MEKIFRIRGGIHPLESSGGKAVTSALAARPADAPAIAYISLSQNIGAPCKETVAPGARVRLGEKVGEPAGFVGAPVHASVSGKVAGIVSLTSANGASTKCVAIENDFADEKALLEPISDPFAASPEALLGRIREAGVVGLGGATFPTQVKLSPPKDKKIDYLLINGAECEPCLTSDHRVMLEHADMVALGARIAAHILGAPEIIVGIEKNKPDALNAMRAAVGEFARVAALPVRYPQGSEKHLIYALTGRVVKSGTLPMDSGCVVMSVVTCRALCEAVTRGASVTERIVTVTGLVKKPQNLIVRVGTPIGEIIAQCGGICQGADEIILGGPMMGLGAFDPSTPTTKGTSGILALKSSPQNERPGPCIRCGRCIEACPMRLMPTALYKFAVHDMFAEAKESRVVDCVECGSCSYVCPAKLPLTQAIRACKREVIKRSKK